LEVYLSRFTRYQGAILRDHQLLLILLHHHAADRSYWVIPGGGKEDGESEEECVIREVKEETNLDVVVEQLLFDEPAHPEGIYRWRKTYLCRPVAGVARPGSEPEVAADFSILDVRWFDLRDEGGWGEALQRDPFTYPQMRQLRDALGYI
jgi:8-oxo-dGTP pyrophosphatase MutT (NUDIX family)